VERREVRDSNDTGAPGPQNGGRSPKKPEDLLGVLDHLVRKDDVEGSVGCGKRIPLDVHLMDRDPEPPRGYGVLRMTLHPVEFEVRVRTPTPDVPEVLPLPGAEVQDPDQRPFGRGSRLPLNPRKNLFPAVIEGGGSVDAQVERFLHPR